LRRLELGSHAITSSDPTWGHDHLDVARAALKEGADAFKLREKRGRTWAHDA